MGDRMLLAPGNEVVQRCLAGNPLPLTANAGLVWSRYLAVWERAREIAGGPARADLHEPLEEFVRAFNARGSGPRNPPRDLLRQRKERLKRALHHWETAGRRMRIAPFTTSGRLILGLGADHPSGNDFTFDSVIGVPYLPGSAVKGLCRRAAELEPLPMDKTLRLFGPERIDAESASNRGGLIFLDAYPRVWPRLAVDIINCHHSDYYGRINDKSDGRPFPSETESPNPVFFLAVEAGAQFGFPIVARDDADLETAVSLLRQGLDLLGIGAKTAVGYGYMDEVTK